MSYSCPAVSLHNCQLVQLCLRLVSSSRSSSSQKLRLSNLGCLDLLLLGDPHFTLLLLLLLLLPSNILYFVPLLRS